WPSSTGCLSASCLSAQERSRGRPPRRCVDALPSVAIVEPGDSRRARGRGECAPAGASHDARPETVSARVRPTVCHRQSGRWHLLCAAGAGVAIMIESATERDVPEILALLERLHLPIDGVDEHLATMLVAREGGHVVGTAALELYADGALLRS